MANPNHWHLYSTETHRQSDISSLLWSISFVDSWLISGDYLNTLAGELKQVPATSFKNHCNFKWDFDKLFSSAHLFLWYRLSLRRHVKGTKTPFSYIFFLSLAINRLIQCCGTYVITGIKKSINNYLKNTLEFQTYLYMRTWNLLDVSFWTIWSVSYYAFNWNTLHRSDISSNIQRTLWNTILQLTLFRSPQGPMDPTLFRNILKCTIKGFLSAATHL